MSDLPDSALGYATVVTEFFLALRGTGLLVSPLDLSLVAEWEARGVPVPVVCRGLRRAAETSLERRRHAGPLRSIRACRQAVEDEWRAFREARVGDAPAPGEEAPAAQGRLAAARELLAERTRAAAPHLAQAYAAALAALAAPSLALPRCAGEGECLTEPAATGDRLADTEALIARADAALQSAYLRALPRAERAALGRRCALVAGARPPAVRRRAWRDTLASHLADQLRAAGLVPLRGSV
ncbi:hypothetical protein [Anaeromyxobacter paludicola]|uniref:Uncharacterized protein n=1 Tax=Anaeromyxobacter paludicola TaxID=2918171 RepID=A0ABM7XAL3_9BACT|nr:hypothetical protein [Anaeromyxobacter paludicola]BDG08892.1 hypothetical protein AMPC_20050 [Anaeromyxobacter paludicola]